MAGEFHPSSTHPPLPPTTEDNSFIHLRLLRSRRVGATTYHRLLSEYGSAETALEALPDIAKAAGAKNYEVCPEAVVAKELRAGKRIGAQLLIHGHAGYPPSLTDLHNAPPVLWALGNTRLLNAPMISVVGARNASSLGTRMAKALAADLGAHGMIVVSGLARGVDAAAHLAALDTGTVAVQAGGVDVMYPAENTQLAEQIAQKGLRISEQPIGLQPQARHFPARNRIIAGLGQACVVVEAAAKSGSLITAKDAADIGRDVMAVPGHPFDARAAGCNMLIRDGAVLVRRAADIVEALGPLAQPISQKMHQGDLALPLPANGPKPSRRDATIAVSSDALHAQILQRLGPNPVADDQLVRDLQTSATSLGHALTELELDGTVQRYAGGLFSKAH